MPSRQIRHSSYNKSTSPKERDVKREIIWALGDRSNALGFTIPWKDIMEAAKVTDPRTLEAIKHLNGLSKGCVRMLNHQHTGEAFVRIDLTEEQGGGWLELPIPNSALPIKGSVSNILITEDGSGHGYSRNWRVGCPAGFEGLYQAMLRFKQQMKAIEDQNKKAGDIVEDWLKQKGSRYYYSSDDDYLIRTWNQVFMLWPELRAVLEPEGYASVTQNTKPKLKQEFLDELVMPSDQEIAFVNTLLTQAALLAGSEDRDKPTIHYHPPS